MSTKTKASVEIAGRKYRNATDPLTSWGTLRRDINTLSRPRLEALLRRELGSETPRKVILRALKGRINVLIRGPGVRGPRAYHRTAGDALGLPVRETWRAPAPDAPKPRPSRKVPGVGT